MVLSVISYRDFCPLGGVRLWLGGSVCRVRCASNCIESPQPRPPGRVTTRRPLCPLLPWPWADANERIAIATVPAARCPCEHLSRVHRSRLLSLSVSDSFLYFSLFFSFFSADSGFLLGQFLSVSVNTRQDTKRQPVEATVSR